MAAKRVKHQSSKSLISDSHINISTNSLKKVIAPEEGEEMLKENEN